MGQTSIPCDSGVRDRLAEDKPSDMSWSEYLSVLHSDQEIVIENTADLSGGLDAVVEELDKPVQLEATEYTKIARQVAQELGQ